MDALAVVGDTYDGPMRNEAGGTVNRPLIVLYKGPDKAYIWGKWFATSGKGLNGVQFSVSGDKIIVHSYNMMPAFVSILSTSDGSIINSFTYTGSI